MSFGFSSAVRAALDTVWSEWAQPVTYESCPTPDVDVDAGTVTRDPETVALTAVKRTYRFVEKTVGAGAAAGARFQEDRLDFYIKRANLGSVVPKATDKIVEADDTRWEVLGEPILDGLKILYRITCRKV